MPKERDPFRKHVEYVEKNEWKCLFCGNKYRGSATRIRAHLAGIPGKGIKGCEKVNNLVRAEASQEKKGEGSGLDKSTGGTSGKGTEGTVFGTGQSVLPRDDASDSNDTQNPNQLRPTGTGTAPACPQDQLPLPPDDMPPDNLDNTQQSVPSNRRLEAAHGNENASSIQQLPMDSSASTSVDFSDLRALLELETHLESEMVEQNERGLSSFPNDEVYGNIGEYLSLDENIADGITPDSLLHPTYWPEPDLDHSLPENLPESGEANVNTFEEIQTNELHNPTVGSSSQIDSSLDVDGANRLLDCGQPCTDEVVPVRSNTSSTDAVQHPGQLPLTSDKEDENYIRQFPSRTPTVIDPSTVLQHSSDSHIFEATIVHSLVPEASTNPVGPSSSHASVPPQRQSVPHQSTNLETAHQNPTVPSSTQAPNNAPPPPQILPYGTDLTDPSSLPDMNEGAPITSHQNTGNNFGESSASKRKLELLYSKEAIVRDELKFAASLSLKKPRMEVVNWLVNVEKLRDDCTKATSEDCLSSNQPVDILLHEVEDLMRQGGKGLFEARETKVNYLIEKKLVGEAFKRNTTEILQYLEGNKISQLGIYGMGGVGKTTIMVRIHNRLKKANYGNVIWITVSQDFNTQMLQDTIGKELGLSISQEKDVRKRAAILCDCLMNEGKSIIILDDVWARFDLEEVGIPMRANGIKLVLTTRSFEVCRQMHCQEMIKIEPLSYKEAKNLFMEELGFEEVLNLEIKGVVKSMVKKCAGLPLAVITMATSMRGVTDVFEWKDCLEKLRESDMGQLDMEKEVLKKLEFSYNRLGNHEVQQCFLSCGLYPEDKLIGKFELIELFIDQGLIDQLKTREKQYYRGLTILNKLANVCLLEDHGKWMKMHNLIRDMALNIMSTTSIVKAQKGLRTKPSEEYWTDALEKVSLMMENDIEEFPLNMSPNCPKLSTLLLNEEGWYYKVIPDSPDSSSEHLGGLRYLGQKKCEYRDPPDLVIPDSFFRHLGALKVLNLRNCKLRELPDSISNLVNLTALLLRGCRKLRHIPHLGKFKSLRKLDISHCVRFEELEGLDMLVNLRYLDIIDTSIKRLPKGTLGALLNLQCLRARLVNGEEITKLQKLETLECLFDNVDDFNKFVRVLCKRGKPRYYYIEVDPGRFHDFFRRDVGQFQDCARSVAIMKRSHAIVSTRGESSGSGSGICILIPQDVRELNVHYCDGATNLSDIGLLEKLEWLAIGRWSNLLVLCGGQGEEVIDIYDSPTRTPTPVLFRSLRDLIIDQCPKLKYLFGHEPKFSLPHLRRIFIGYCAEIVGIATSPPPYPPPAFPSLEDIYVSGGCHKMKRVVEFEWLPHFPNLRKIEVEYCINVEEIIGGLSSYMSVEEISPERLQNIQVIGCEGMPEMISGVGRGQERSMTTPVNNTPSSSQSSISLPKLNTLRLHGLDQLKSICEVPITCSSMRHLKVTGCPELNRIPLELQLRDIEDLPYIEVEGEEKWKTLIWDHPDAQAILQSHLLFMGSYCILKGRRNSQSSDGEDE